MSKQLSELVKGTVNAKDIKDLKEAIKKIEDKMMKIDIKTSFSNKYTLNDFKETQVTFNNNLNSKLLNTYPWLDGKSLQDLLCSVSPVVTKFAFTNLIFSELNFNNYNINVDLESEIKNLEKLVPKNVPAKIKEWLFGKGIIITIVIFLIQCVQAEKTNEILKDINKRIQEIQKVQQEQLYEINKPKIDIDYNDLKLNGGENV